MKILEFSIENKIDAKVVIITTNKNVLDKISSKSKTLYSHDLT